MNLLMALIGAVVLALSGVGTLRWVWPSIRQAPPPVRLALGFCAGCFLETIIFWVAFVAGVPFTRGLVLGPAVVLAIPGMLTIRRGWSKPQFDLAGTFAVLLVLLALALGWSRPVYGY